MRLLLHTLPAFVVAGAASAQVAIGNGQVIPHPTPQASEHFGSVVTIDGDDLAIAAPNASVGAYLGAVYIYTRTPAGWQLQSTLTPPSPVEPGQFGRSLSIDSQDGRIAIGAQEPYSSAITGAVFLFKRTGTSWSHEDTIAQWTDFFGCAVALDGDWLAVGDKSIDTVRVYQRQPLGFWLSTATPAPPPNPNGGGYGRGCVLGLRGDRLVIGSPHAEVYVPQYNWHFPIGEVEIYARNGTSWPWTASVHSSDYGTCGNWLAFDGDVLAVRSSSSFNAVDIFRRVTDSYWPVEYRISGVAQGVGTFGMGLALSGQQLLVGTNAPVGAALYEYRGATSQPPWVGVAQFSEPTMTNVAGKSLALSATSAVIGDANHLNAGVASGDAFAFGVAAGIKTYCTGKLNSDSCIPNITWNGLPSVDPATFAYFWITAEQVVPQKYGTFFYGAAAGSSPFHGGTLCVASPVHRTALTNSAGFSSCSGLLSINFTLRIQSGVDPALIAGANVFGQWWYRDPDTTPQGGLSNAIQFAIWP